MFAKIDVRLELRHTRCLGMVLQHIVVYFLKILGFKVYIVNFLVQKIIFWKIRDSHLKDLLTLRLSMLFIRILDKTAILVIFQTSVFDQNGMTLNHLHRYN